MVKAVCSSAVKKLAVLSLAVAVSSGAVASATPPKKNIPGLPSTTQGEETPQDRLRRLERERAGRRRQVAEKRRQVAGNGRQAAEKRRQAEEKERQAKEKTRQAEKNGKQGKITDVMRLNDEVISLYVEVVRLNNEAICLYVEADRLYNEAGSLAAVVSRLDLQIAALRVQIEAEQQEEPVEEIVEIASADDEMKEEVEADEQRENDIRTTSNTTLRDIVRNVTTLSGQMVQPQQNQPDKYFGGFLNPFNWFK